MSYRAIRRRLRQAAARYDWLEGFLVALGLVFLAVSALCIYATVVVAVHLADPDTAFPTGPDSVRGLKGFGLVFFPVFAVVSFFVGDFLSGGWLRRAVRRLLRRSPRG